MGLHDLAQRPERDPLAVGQAATLPPGRELGSRVDVGEQLSDDPALPDPRLADNRHQLNRPRRDGLVEEAFQERQVDLPAHERRIMRPRQIRPEPRTRALRVEHPGRLSLPLQERRLQLLVVEHGRGRLVGRETHRDTHLRRDRLQAGSRVDRIARQQPLAQPRRHTQPHQRLARCSPRPSVATARRRPTGAPRPPRRSEDQPEPPVPDRPRVRPAHRTPRPPHPR